MKKIVLIGDSIRISYEPFVKEELAGVADVWGPEMNGGHSINILIHLHLWVAQRQPDVVHINCGLHDLKTTEYGGKDNLIPIPFYRLNLERIFTIIRKQTRAELFWCTTTPVGDSQAEAAHEQYKDFSRYNADVLAYNQCALEVAAQFDVKVNDLYTAVKEAGPVCATTDGVHYEEEGKKYLGRRVASFLREHVAGLK